MSVVESDSQRLRCIPRPHGRGDASACGSEDVRVPYLSPKKAAGRPQVRFVSAREDPCPCQPGPAVWDRTLSRSSRPGAQLLAPVGGPYTTADAAGAANIR